MDITTSFVCHALQDGENEPEESGQSIAAHDSADARAVVPGLPLDDDGMAGPQPREHLVEDPDREGAGVCRHACTHDSVLAGEATPP